MLENFSINWKNIMLIGLPSELGIEVDLEKENFLTITTRHGRYTFSYQKLERYIYCYCSVTGSKSRMYSMHLGKDGKYKVFSFSRSTLDTLRKELLELRSLKLQEKWSCTSKNLKELKIG